MLFKCDSNKLPENIKEYKDYLFILPDLISLIYRLLKDKSVPVKTKLIISVLIAVCAVFVPIMAARQQSTAMAAEKEYCSVEDILQIAHNRGERPFIVIADGITDPHNLGALIRCAEGVGAHGLIIPKRRAVGLTPVVTKSSCGAIEHLAVAKVANLSSAIQKLKDAGVWIFAAEAGGEPYYGTDFRCPVALVLGSEGDGVSHIIRENADYITSIPMYGQVNSFNVSTAAAVILSEIARQHRS